MKAKICTNRALDCGLGNGNEVQGELVEPGPFDLWKPSEYIVFFSCEGHGIPCCGRHLAGSLPEDERTFEILYDPENPEDSTGSEVRPIEKSWIRVVFAAAGISVAAVLA
jgi:hypothetical protein